MEKEKSGEIVFYCKDCEEVVDTERCGKKYVYRCKKCGTKNVAFGTEKSIYNFFHIEEEDAATAADQKERIEKAEVKK